MTPTPNSTKDGQDDLAILYPERHATIAGVAVVMREYGFVESLQLHKAIAALTAAMTDVALAGKFTDLESMRGVFGQCVDQVMQLTAIACDQPESWVRSLTGGDGESLLLLWWSVNAPFFLQRVLMAVRDQKAREAAGVMFSAPLSPTDTAPETSTGTPSDS